MRKTGRLYPDEGIRLQKAGARISDHLVHTVGSVRLMLPTSKRDTYRYYHIAGLRPCKKGELYMDGDNHIACKAECDGEPHWVNLILTPCVFGCPCRA